MKKAVLSLLIAGALALTFWFGLNREHHTWSGVDDTVVGRFAREADRPPGEPLINIAKGDLSLFVFLVAGMIGGFAGGYYFRELFPPRGKKDSHHV
jgi:cobalt/nickel transport protein